MADGWVSSIYIFELRENICQAHSPNRSFLRSDQQFIGEDRTSVSYFSKLGEDLNIKLRKLIEDGSFGKELGFMNKIRQYYHSCRNTGRQTVIGQIVTLRVKPPMMSLKINSYSFELFEFKSEQMISRSKEASR